MSDSRAGDGAFKRFTYLAFILAILFASSKIIEGLLIALIVVAGVFITTNAIPMLKRWTLNPESNTGYAFMVVMTAVIVHLVVGPGTLGGIIATAFAIVIKMIVLDSIRNWLSGKNTSMLTNPLGWLLCREPVVAAV